MEDFKHRGVVFCFGTDQYDCERIKNLDNAVNDARGFAEKMKTLDFYVFEVYDGTGVDFEQEFIKFKEMIKSFNTCVFYFSGHGIENGGENFLLAKDSVVTDENVFLKQRSLNLQQIINEISETGCPNSIFIIDACRNNPYNDHERGEKNKFLSAPVSVPKGSLIAFSTSPGEGANDGFASFPNHSLYTGSLLKHLDEEGLEIEQLFKKVRTEVHNLSKGNKTPWEHTSLIGQFIFNIGRPKILNNLPYDPKAIKDSLWDSNELKEIILDFKTANWYKQNPAIERLLQFKSTISPDCQFVIGRNLTQMFQGDANGAIDFIEDPKNIERFSAADGKNHILNGILFEIYFNSKGEFRYSKKKGKILPIIISYSERPQLKSSFDFIEEVLIPFSQYLLFIPSSNPQTTELYATIDRRPLKNNLWGIVEDECYVIEQIKHGGTQLLTDDITNQIDTRNDYFENTNALRNQIAQVYSVPPDFIKLTHNKEPEFSDYVYLDSQRFKIKLN